MIKKVLVDTVAESEGMRYFSDLKQTNKQKTSWPESASELCRRSDRRLSAKSVPTFVDLSRPDLGDLYCWLFNDTVSIQSLTLKERGNYHSRSVSKKLKDEDTREIWRADNWNAMRPEYRFRLWSVVGGLFQGIAPGIICGAPRWVRTHRLNCSSHWIYKSHKDCCLLVECRSQ
jgi:hypothetical protein